MGKLKPNDALFIPQPSYSDLWRAWVEGMKAGQKYQQASEEMINKGADAFCKLVHLEKNPDSFKALGK